MNIKALITTLAIVGSSSAAMASPSFTFSAGAEAHGSWTVGTDLRNGNSNSYGSSYGNGYGYGNRNDDDDRRDVTPDRDHRRPTDPVYRPAPRPWPQPMPPVYLPPPPPAPVVDCNNTRVGADVSVYTGPVGSAPAYGRGLVPITDPTRIDSGREFITVGAQHGRFDTIQLRETRGSTYIIQVGVEFLDGGHQKIAVDRALDRNNPTLTIDLDGHDRPINRIIVYGATAPHAAYQVLGA